ncbi:A disintegrin and metalloproteinase with thrombospondin motifs 12 [Sarcophilus harrisii]|uniref:ADAM metallopeptidase with thrombospondin type 1 motif 12 n=2 Tax=Sarcophilus harrisii TaxID=9305 RepID=A0A7N4V3E7_SARHA|nr:A disintegrin and metalloproteinase with thrombospondin motifs 12 [Sarcophilus harrisii]
MPWVPRNWVGNIFLVVQFLDFQALCNDRQPQPGAFSFPDKRQEHFIKTLSEYHVVGPVKVNATGHFVSHALHHHASSGGNARRRRDLEHQDDQVYYKIAHEDKNLFFNLTVNRGFLFNNYILERRYGNLTGAKMESHSGSSCHFHGTVLQSGVGDGTAALSACKGLTGFFRLPHGDYFIEPVKMHPLAEGKHHPHIIYKRQVHPDSLKRRWASPEQKEPACGLNDSRAIFQQQEQQRERWERNNVSKKRLSRRSISKERWVETLVVADTKMIEYHGSDSVESYILTIMNMVTGLFHNPSIGNAIHIVVVRLILLEEEEQGLKIVHHADKTLASFCKWQKSINPKSDLNPAHHDVAVLLTRKDICAGVNHPCETLGLSHLSGMCQPHRSCNINEDSGLPLAFTIAHELGHSFGIQHDGRENDCEPVGRHPYIMSRQLQYDPTPLTWSKCSKEYITRFLDRGWGFCLDDVPQKKGLKSKVIAPGVIYDIHHQCQLQYGPNATFCQEVDNICQTLWCSVKGSCRSKLDAAADGTRCGEKKWCMAGKCITVGKKPESIPGGWGRWSPWSHCSRTCGAGVQSAERLCNNPEPKFGGKYCTGERKRYRLCNIHPCRIDVPTFRQMQCSEFDTVPYKNEFYHWFPVFNSEYPCELYCRPIDGQFSEKMLDAVIDGTPCFEGGNSRNVCINGICKMVGCDYEIDSNATEDRCGVCLGDGSACHTVKKIFKQKEGFGYVDIGLIPKGARDIRVVEVEEAGNFLAIRSEDPEKYYLNGGFIIQWNGDYKLAGTVFQYDRKGDLENLRAAGPTNESVWIQLLFQVTNPGIKYEYTIRKDGSSENDIEKPQYFWQYGSWTDCSATCGTGIRRQTARCMKKGKGMVRATFCDPETQPNGRQKKCYERDCPPRWWAGEWQACSATCGLQGEKKRTVLCIQTVGSDEQALPAKDCHHLLKPKTLISCNRDVLCPSDWTVSNWSECTVSCGGGVRIRNVTCAKNNDEPCDFTKKPNSRALCGLQQCPSGRQLLIPPLKPKKGPIPNRRTLPKPKSTPSRPPPMPSSTVLTTPMISETVNMSTTTTISPSPAMSSEDQDPTGGKLQNNSISSELDPPVSIVPTENTSQPNPTTGSISTQTSNRITTSKGNISHSKMTSTSKVDFVVKTDVTPVLPFTISPVTLQVTPIFDHLTEEPEIEIHSGSGEDSEQHIDKTTDTPVMWTKSKSLTSQFPSLDEISMPPQPQPTPYLSDLTTGYSFSTTADGLLSSTRISQQSTTLEYGTLDVNAIVTKKPSLLQLQPLQKIEPMPHKKLLTHMQTESMSNKTVSQGLESDLTEEDAKNLIAEGFLLNASNYNHLKVPSPTQSIAYWIVGNWSECSTTCGLGALWRHVECSTQIDSDCESIQKPDPAKRCHLRPCAGWKVGTWSKCSRDCGGGIKAREVRCVNSHDHRNLRPFHCQLLENKPQLSTTCNMEPCQEWKTEPWSQCSKTCGGGIQERLVHCPGDRCDWQMRPDSTRHCNRHSCSHWVKGTWNLCTVSCGGGIQQRMVQCINSESNKTEDPSLCESTLKPLESRKCNEQECRKHTDIPCRKDKLTSIFCQTLKTMGKCSVITLRAQCCYTCGKPHTMQSRQPKNRHGFRKSKLL